MAKKKTITTENQRWVNDDRATDDEFSVVHFTTGVYNNWGRRYTII